MEDIQNKNQIQIIMVDQTPQLRYKGTNGYAIAPDGDGSVYTVDGLTQVGHNQDDPDRVIQVLLLDIMIMILEVATINSQMHLFWCCLGRDEMLDINIIIE